MEKWAKTSGRSGQNYFAHFYPYFLHLLCLVFGLGLGLMKIVMVRVRDKG